MEIYTYDVSGAGVYSSSTQFSNLFDRKDESRWISSVTGENVENNFIITLPYYLNASHIVIGRSGEAVDNRIAKHVKIDAYNDDTYLETIYNSSDSSDGPFIWDNYRSTINGITNCLIQVTTLISANKYKITLTANASHIQLCAFELLSLYDSVGCFKRSITTTDSYRKFKVTMKVNNDKKNETIILGLRNLKF